jgi:hypothetical protein
MRRFRSGIRARGSSAFAKAPADSLRLHQLCGAPEPEPGPDAPSSTEVLPYFFVEAFECGCSTLTAVAM